VAVGRSRAKRILIPMNHCDNIVAGMTDLSVNRLIQGALEEIKKISSSPC
jgi:hypothetical protein